MFIFVIWRAGTGGGKKGGGAGVRGGGEGFDRRQFVYTVARVESSPCGSRELGACP